jgi:hypothetical protein
MKLYIRRLYLFLISLMARSLLWALFSGEEGGDLLMKHFHNGSVSSSSPQSLTIKPTASGSPALSAERHVSWHWNVFPLSQHSNAVWIPGMTREEESVVQ